MSWPASGPGTSGRPWRPRPAKRRTNGHASLPTYKSYLFRDKDPAIDSIRTLVEQHYGEKVTGKLLNDISETGGPTATCMRAWFFGDTKRPKNATLEAAGRAMGYERVWKRMRTNQPTTKE